MKQTNLTVKLISIAGETREYVNSQNETKRFYPCTVEFTTKHGEIKTALASIPEKNYNHGMETGKSYLANVKLDDNGQVYMSVSHLVSGSLLNEDDFDFSEVETNVTTNSALA